MAKLLNIYNTGLIVETHILETEEEAKQIFNKHVENLENDYQRGVTTFSCTEIQGEIETPAPKKKKSNKK